MGEIANQHVANFTSGRWGIPLPRQYDHPTTTKAALAGRRFSVVKVLGGRTNRMPGTKLVVCDNTPDTYWVWTSKGVTGISKDVCQVLRSDLDLATALRSTGRKPYVDPAASI